VAASAGVPAEGLAARAAAGRDILAAPDAGQFVVQLMVTDARERAYLSSYLAEAAQSLTAAKIFLAASGSAEAPRYGVLYGPFAARSEAAEALNALPLALRQFGPYVRTLDAVREESARAQRR
jgi:septal ring-binding cell division protein DamX